MKIKFFLVAAFIIIAPTIYAQSDSTKGTFLKPNPRNYDVKQAFEVESLFPMFFSRRIPCRCGLPLQQISGLE